VLSLTNSAWLTDESIVVQSCSTNVGIIDCGTFSARMACACHPNVELSPDGG